MITVIYTIRDRDPSRLRQSVNSLRKASEIEFDVVVVDYGSRSQELLNDVCRNLSVRRIRCEAEGLPWCKAHAINIAVKNSKTEYVALTDIDMIFETDILKVSLDKSEPKTDIHCRPLWLPASGNKSKAKLGNYSQLGGYQFIAREAFINLNGMNEQIHFWGDEDTEWALRLKNNGYRQVWIEEEAKMYHHWHEPSVGIYDQRPHSVVSETWNSIILSVNDKSTMNRSWGENLSLDDRPILEYLSKFNPEFIEVKNYIQNLPNFLEQFKNKEFICLDFGYRFQVKNALEGWLATIINTLDKRIFKRWGFEIKKRRNVNFDQWYTSLSYLKENGLIDYYMGKDFERVYMLFKNK